MRNLSLPGSVFTTPTIADVNGDLSPAHLGLADDLELETDEDRRAERECQQREDEGRCRR
jgi:hypothetical protein